MPQSSIDQLRMNYRDDVSYTLSRIKSRCPSCYVALAGPEMIGEGPLFPVRLTPLNIPPPPPSLPPNTSSCLLTTCQYTLSYTL